MQKYKIITYGCQMNVHESEKIAGTLEYMGYSECKECDEADIIVFNTCCIRDNAEQHAMGNIGAIKKLKKSKPDMIVAVVGCMTQQEQTAADVKKKFPFVDIILGTNNLNKLEQCISERKNRRKKTMLIDPSEYPEIIENQRIYRTSGTNAWLNIMYGCNNFCTYCIVPYVRGRERSRKMSDILDEFKSLLDQGYKEITLLGQNVNSYGSNLEGGESFAKLLEEIAKLDDYTKHRVRFMTSHPKDLSGDVIDIIASSKSICNNIHLPIQSGSDKILKLMNRHYTRDYYLKVVDNIRSKIPDCGITTDIMVGFPYEDDDDFEDTLDIVRKVGFSTAFTFVYSIRRGTAAAKMPQVAPEVAKQRIMRLIEEQNAVTAAISKSYENKTFEVLCEDVNEKLDGYLMGRTDSGRLVNFEGKPDMVGRFVNVKIEKSKMSALYGKIEE